VNPSRFVLKNPNPLDVFSSIALLVAIGCSDTRDRASSRFDVSPTGGGNSSAIAGALGTAGASATTGGNPTGGNPGNPTGGNPGNPTGGNPTGGTQVILGGAATGGTQADGGSEAAGGTFTLGGAGTAGGNDATGGTAPSGGADATGGDDATGGATLAAVSTGTGDDGCSGALARGITLSEVAVFQSGKISVMKAGVAVPAATQYGAEIIEGRPTLFRMYVTVDSGFAPRLLSARLLVNGSKTPYYSKQTISRSSTELSPTDSFQIQVPASEIRSGLDYSVRIVECETASGLDRSPQFPATGSATLETRLTGAIKVTLVPVTSARESIPTLDSSYIASVSRTLDAMYPTSGSQVTVAATPVADCKIVPGGDESTWSDCLDLIRARRTSDGVASDVYYLGIVQPAPTLDKYCGKSCVTGMGYVSDSTSTQAALAISYLPESLNTCAHELGHSHGVSHSPGCGAMNADNSFPYVANGQSLIGWTGWTNRAPSVFLDPAVYTDIMAYCKPQWVSDYVYAQWTRRVAKLNEAASVIGVPKPSSWRLLSIIRGVAKWSISVIEPPSGDPHSATIINSNGQGILDVSVYRTNVSIEAADEEFAASYMVPSPEADWAAIQIDGIQVKF
jgi:hypothetical protein